VYSHSFSRPQMSSRRFKIAIDSHSRYRSASEYPMAAWAKRCWTEPPWW
jgi:hypothetical protein